MATALSVPHSSENPANFVRTVRLRSDVDAQYSPRYNRMQFTIEPDHYSTDLSESYLALRMYLTTSAGQIVPKASLAQWALLNTYVSFGQNGNTYTPMSMIKLCRLFTGDMQILEETNFQNVLSETLNQVYADYESVGSSSLTSNSSVVFGQPQSLGSFFANLLPDYTGSNEQLPVEVHIPLKKLFGFFRNKNVYLDDPALNGLKIWLELEDRKPILQSITCTEYATCPSEAAAFGQGGMEYTLAANPWTSLTAQNDIGQMTQGADIPQPGLVPTNADTLNMVAVPSYIIQKDQILSFFNSNIALTTDTLTLNATWTNQEIQQMNLVVGNYAKLNFRFSAVGGLTGQRQNQITSEITQIESVTLEGNGTVTIGLLDAFRQRASVQWATSLDSVEIMDNVHCVELPTVSTLAEITALQQNNTISIAQAEYDALQNLGLISVDGLPTNGKFVLNTQITAQANSTAIEIQPYFDQFYNPDVPSARQIVSNGCQKLPIQGSSCTLLSIDPVSSTPDVSYNLVFSNLGLTDANSLVPSIFLDGFVYEDGVDFNGNPIECSYKTWITNANVSGGAIPTDDFSYMVDKAELVLVQGMRDPKIPMSRVYTTWRVEVATIENPLPIYQRQFIVTEQNCYSVLLCMPQYSTGTTPVSGTTGYEPQSLISFNRGVQAYRFSVNNIDDTNRDLEVSTNTSFYPSSLHLEKLMDTLENDGGRSAKSLSGILTVPHSVHPLVALPLKVYNVREGMNYVMKPEGYQVQITLYGDVAHNQPITPGPIFLFKQCLRTI